MQHKIIIGDSKDMNFIEDNSIGVIVTSPPYFNAKEYSEWNSYQDYLDEMEFIFRNCYRKLKNFRYLIINVGDVITKTNKNTTEKLKFMLSCDYVIMLRKIGFVIIDDYIWDKGEPQSNRFMFGLKYKKPFYHYPANCYEHIFVFQKKEIDYERIQCPICNSSQVCINGYNVYGQPSFECKNPSCTKKSKSGRGYRFDKFKVEKINNNDKKNIIPKDVLMKWRKDIVKINPVIKIGAKGKNTLGHTAPFPEEIPEFAIRCFSYVDDVVLDPFLGCGTTTKVARDLKRNSIGIEKNIDYLRAIKTKIVFGQQQMENGNEYEIIIKSKENDK